MGHELRKVPAHMPHFINRGIIAEMQQRWPLEWDVTSSNRFRSNKDMQYSFAYYHYLINRHKLKVGYPEIYKYLARQIDTNNDGYIDVFNAGSAFGGQKSRLSFLMWNPSTKIFDEKNLINNGKNNG
jgi:hypothetical protein